MKVLWIVNILFPEAERQITGVGSLKSSGGWMLGAAEELVRSGDVDLAVATPSSLVNEMIRIDGDNILYYVFPLGKGNTKYNKKYEYYWRLINDEYNPDVIHIHGTEFSHGLAYVNACGSKHVVVSIQGLVSIISNYYNYGISIKEIFRNISLRDIYRGTLLQAKKRFERRGLLEIELLKRVNHVIGRTEWDKSHVMAINPMLHYYSCNETLRHEFYDGPIWEYNSCIRHSIFLSQAEYPVKGLHQLLKAMPLITKMYPNTIIRIAGKNIIRERKLWHFLPIISGYGKLVRSLIRKYHLTKNIFFVGSLNAEEMKHEYLGCNVFLCPSSIENSPNSIGEAQVLGVPVVAAYVGGIPEMMKGDELHLYRYEDVVMLAYAVCDVFQKKEKQVDMRSFALKRHNQVENLKETIEIYQKILAE